MTRISTDRHDIAAGTLRAGLNEIESARRFAKIPHLGAAQMWGAMAARSLQWAVCFANGIIDLDDRYPRRPFVPSPSTPTQPGGLEGLRLTG